ncbi:hypothetical protein D3C75_1269240 [compost metagenome]
MEDHNDQEKPDIPVAGGKFPAVPGQWEGRQYRHQHGQPCPDQGPEHGNADGSHEISVFESLRIAVQIEADGDEAHQIAFGGGLAA